MNSGCLGHCHVAVKTVRVVRERELRDNDIMMRENERVVELTDDVCDGLQRVEKRRTQNNVNPMRC